MSSSGTSSTSSASEISSASSTASSAGSCAVGSGGSASGVSSVSGTPRSLRCKRAVSCATSSLSLKARDDANVVLHCHSIYATTLAVHHKTIPSFHYMTGVAGGTTIRCARYATFGTQALSDAALEALEGRLACLLGQHGQISLGKSLESALWLAIEVETLSRMYVQALTLGEPPVLPDDEMERVIAQMKRMSYGFGPEAEGSNDIARPRG